jgi:hypothetical protein
MLLYRFAKSPLKLLPTHADRSGGLGIMILAQRSFSFIFFAGSMVISGQLIVLIMNSPDAILMVQRVGIGYIILCLLLLLLPLFFFIGKLVKTKQMGLLRLSKLGTEMSRTFEGDWLTDIPFEKRIEDRRVDPSMAYDYASMYDVLQQLRVVPVTARDIISIAVTIAIPFLPILFVYFSAAEVLEKIIGLLLWLATVVLLYGFRGLCPSCGRDQGDSDLERLTTMLWGRRKTCLYCGAKLDRSK